MKTEELIARIEEIDDIHRSGSTSSLGDRELCDLSAVVEEMQATLHGLTMRVQADAASRKVHRVRKFRSSSTFLASHTRLHRNTCGRHINLARNVIEYLPKIHTAYIEGFINRDQLELLARQVDDVRFREAAIASQDYFLSLAHEQWPWFWSKINEWVEMVDDRDPQDKDDKAFMDRRLIWGDGAGRVVLAELNLPTEQFEQILAVLSPIYDQLLKQEWRDAKVSAGLDPSACTDEESQLRFSDLARTDKQRWADALLIAVRAGGSLTGAAIAKAARGEILTTADLDPGILAEVIIVCDQETIEREISRQNGIECERRSKASMARYRCETISGKPVSPAAALQTLHLGTFRRLVLKSDPLDFEISREARFFKGPKRLGIMIRDRFCQGAGCGSSIRTCQADHVVEYRNRGATVPTNGRMLCGPCHRHKTKLQSLGLWEDPISGGRTLVDNKIHTNV